jgi:hypothetical protein
MDYSDFLQRFQPSSALRHFHEAHLSNALRKCEAGFAKENVTDDLKPKGPMSGLTNSKQMISF